MSAEEPYSTLEVDDRDQVQPNDQEGAKSSINNATQSEHDEPIAASRPAIVKGFSDLEAYHPDYTTWNADEPAALEAYHPSWNNEDQGIIPVITPDAEPATNADGAADGQGEEQSKPPAKRRICGVSRLVFFLLLGLAIAVVAAAIAGSLVATAHGHTQSAHRATASSSSAISVTASVTPSATSTSSSSTTSATAIPTYGANITNCNQNAFHWYAGAQVGACHDVSPKQGFEVIALGENCTVTHFSDYACQKNATLSTLYHCYDLVESFTVDNCN